MNIDPEAQRYSKVFGSDDVDSETFLKQMREAEEQAHNHEQRTGNSIVEARSTSKDQLQKLQDDLRKAGYKRMR